MWKVKYSLACRVLRFTGHFQYNAGKDPGHYVRPNAIIEFGSLSNSMLCLCDRNMHGGMRGCVRSPQALKLEDCKCSAKPLLDGDMMYSMAKLKHVDSAWYNSIMGGHEWQILSSDMDKEEPRAARIISMALSNRNAIAMRTAHMEIMRTLVKLCDPDPKTLMVPFDRGREHLLKLFGSTSHYYGYCSAWRIVCKTGGKESKIFSDLFKWADL